MKIIKYQLATKIDLDGVMAVTLSGVTMPYTDANYAIAQAEAYQGQITVEDDERPEPEPEPEYVTYEELAEAIREGVNAV